jgi:chromosome segregation ATPase
MHAKKILQRSIDSVSSLLSELYAIGAVEKLIAEQKERFDGLRSEAEATTQQLADLQARLGQAQGELAQAQGECEQFKKETLALRDEHRRLSTDITNIRKKLEAK